MGIPTRRLPYGKGTIAAALGVAAIAATALTAQAGGQPNYEGLLAGANPTGYLVSPAAYDISSGPVTVSIQQSVTNLTSQAQTVPLNLRVHHFLTLNGQDISDGQPGQTGITWTKALLPYATQVLIGQTPTVNVTVPPMGAPATVMTWSWTFTSCGYFQFDIANSPPPILGSGFIRVLGCGGTGAPRLTPGYWKNHAAATTALLPVKLGNFTVSTFTEAQAIFDAMKCNAPANCLAGHLLAAELDVASGSATCIQPVIADANSLLASIGYAGVGSYSLTSAQSTQALNDEALLDSYTNDSTSLTC